MRFSGGLWAAALAAQTALLPLSEVKPGLRGVGKTVFKGDRIEEFQVEILGVIENVGPRQSLILGRLAGGPLGQSGVLQGMSGSPVYIGGKLAGAVATTFPYAKEPIAGIRPIEEMLRVPAGGGARTLDEVKRAEWRFGESRMVDIATPVSFSGFTTATLDHFRERLRALGFEPVQGALGGSGPPAARPRPLDPGAMISVQLVRGDLNIAADGTVTHVDGRRIYAFGHRFLAAGATEMPFARAEVLTLVPALATSFKISTAREALGTITADYSAAVAGELGRTARMVPVEIRVKHSRMLNYRMEMIRDRLLTPFLLQMATYSALDSTERASGAATVAVTGRVEWLSGAPPLGIRNVYAGDTAVGLLASMAGAVPLGYALRGGFPELSPKSVQLEAEIWEEKRDYQVERVWLSRPEARAGEEIEIRVTLTGPGGREVERPFRYRIPPGAAAGAWQVTVSDATATNFSDYAHILSQAPATAGQVLAVLGGLRPNNVAVLRLARSEAGFAIRGERLPAPPPSLGLILRRSPAEVQQQALSRAAEFEIRIDNGVITGSKSVPLEVKEP